MKVLVCQYISLLLNFYMVFYDISGALIGSFAGILYHQCILIFPNSFNVYTDTLEVLVYS